MSRLRDIPLSLFFSGIFSGFVFLSAADSLAQRPDGQTILKTETLGVILPADGVLTPAMEALILKTDNALPYPKAYRFVVKKIERDPIRVFAAARDLSEKENARFIFSSLGSYDSLGLLKPGVGNFDALVLPFLDRGPVDFKKGLVVTAALPDSVQGAAAGKWAVRRYKRVLLIHSEESPSDVDFALSFEKTFKSSGKERQIRRESFPEKTVNFETYKDLLKNFFPDLVVFPAMNPEVLQKMNAFLLGQNYSGTVLGNEGWLSKELINPQGSDWIGRYVVSAFPGPFTDEALDHPEFSVVLKSFQWMTNCMKKKVFADISACLRRPLPGGFLSKLASGGQLLKQKIQPTLWQLNRGGPRKIQDLEVLKSN